MNVLHELDGEEVADTESDDFLKDALVFPPESEEADDSTFELWT